MKSVSVDSFVLDGSNIAYPNGGGRPRLWRIIAVRDALSQQFSGARIEILADASFIHVLHQHDSGATGQYERMVMAGEIHQSPAEADDFVLKRARKLKAAVVSNDRFRQSRHRQLREGVPILNYMVYDDGVDFFDFVYVHASGVESPEKRSLTFRVAAPKRGSNGRQDRNHPTTSGQSLRDESIEIPTLLMQAVSVLERLGRHSYASRFADELRRTVPNYDEALRTAAPGKGSGRFLRFLAANPAVFDVSGPNHDAQVTLKHPAGVRALHATIRDTTRKPSLAATGSVGAGRRPVEEVEATTCNGVRRDLPAFLRAIIAVAGAEPERSIGTQRLLARLRAAGWRWNIKEFGFKKFSEVLAEGHRRGLWNVEREDHDVVVRVRSVEVAMAD